MSLRSHCTLAAAWIAAVVPALAAPQDDNVWIVDNSGAPADFTELEAAVSAAVDGDVVLVKEGNYGPFVIEGKGVTVVGELGADVRVRGPLQVLAVPAGSRTVLRNLRTSTPVEHGIELDFCQGSVHLEECHFVGQNTPSNDFSFDARNHGARIDRCMDVRLVRSTFRGGGGGNIGTFFTPSNGGHGVWIEKSTVSATHCEGYGGFGADAPYDDWYSGGSGGHGFYCWDSTLWVDGCHGQGGSGGMGDYDYNLFGGSKQCGDGGHGGDGLSVQSFPEFIAAPDSAASQVTYRGFTGLGGTAGGTICGQPGDPGEVVFEGGPELHAVTALAGSARNTYVPSPLRGGEVAVVHMTGEPGDYFIALLGAGNAPLELPGQPLPLMVYGNAPAVLLIGLADAGGDAQAQFPVPPQPLGFGGTSLSLQGVLLPTGETELQTAPVSVFTVLEQGL